MNHILLLIECVDYITIIARYLCELISVLTTRLNYTAERQLVSPLRHAKFCCGSLTAPSSCLWHAFGLVFEPRYEFCAARWAIKTHYEFFQPVFAQPFCTDNSAMI